MTSTTREKTGKKGTDKEKAPAIQKRSAANSAEENPVPLAASPAKAALPVAISTRPSNQEVAWVAYELFLQSGGEHGRDLEHWYKAETILSGKR